MSSEALQFFLNLHSYSVHLEAILPGGNSYLFLEESDEVLRILKAEALCDLLGILRRIKQLALGHINHLKPDIFLRGLAGLGLHKVAEIIRRQTHLVGEEFHSRNSLHLSGATIKIIVDELFKPAHDAGVHLLSCYELPFIESHAVV